MRKRMLFLTALLLLILAACAGKEVTPAEAAKPAEAAEPESPPAAVTEPAPEPEPGPVETAMTEPVPEPGPASEPAPAPEPEPVPGPDTQPPAAGATLEGALACVGQEIDALYAAVGMPVSTHYEFSCSGPGDDGVLYYDGFLVFTYKENGVETVLDAEAD